MTVYISADAKNLREELASLRNQGGYQEQQFYFDGLVTNGTFDSDTTGWAALRGAGLSVSANKLRITYGGTASPIAYQSVKTIAGASYTISVDYTAGTGGGSSLWVSASYNSNGLNELVNDTLSAGANVNSFTATSNTTHIYLVSFSNAAAEYDDFDNVSVFETDGTDVIHTMPKGWKPKDVYEDGLLQREGAAHDYEVVYDGFDYYVKPTVAPSATTQTCVIGVKA